MDSKKSNQVTKSLQNLLKIPTVYISSPNSSNCRSRSLPNICMPQRQDIITPFDDEVTSKKHHHKQKILKKTWDKVKTAIIHSTSANSYRRGSLKNKGESKPNISLPSTNPVSSAPSTPLHKQTFDFDSQPTNPSQNQRLSNLSDRDALCTPPPSNSKIGQSFVHPIMGSTPSPVPGTNTAGLGSSVKNCASVHGTDSHSQSPDIDIEETEKIQRNYAQLQKRLSEELHQRMNEYKLDPKHTTENLSEEFKKRLQQWEMWKLSTGKVTYTEEELQQLLPEDFSKKLHEWECIKTGGISPSHGYNQSNKTHDNQSRKGTSSPEVTTSKNKLLRKKKNSDSSRQKELAWLEKQLEKIEVEKKRLEREMKKYMEREARLEKMKEALQNTSINDVWIKTPTAKCKVEKLTEKFTKRLYEWEEKKGIQPESSTMSLLHPKYYAPGPDDDEVELRARTEFNATRYDDDTPAFSSSRDSESRQDECEVGDDIGCEIELEEPDDDHEEEKKELDDEHNIPEEERRPSSASSSDFEEATDSFAAHDKGNSGASNTDSDFFRADYPCSRRRSSEAISTPLSARSPSLSAFTSDDEGEMCGLLKTVSEENENTNTLKEVELINTVKDAESQTEVILKAKPIVVENSDDDEEILEDSQTGVFVQTKRTIFTPILDETDKDKLILIEQDLKSPTLIKALMLQSETTKTSVTNENPTPLVHEEDEVGTLGGTTFTNVIFPPAVQPQPSLTNSQRLTLSRPPPPRIVDAIPKIPYATSGTSVQMSQRAFPKMGKIPVWCSPLGSRRHLGAGAPVSASTSGIAADDLGAFASSLQHSTSIDFTIDRFLQDSNLLYNKQSRQSESIISASQPTSNSSTKIPTVTPKIGRRNTSAAVPVPEASGLVGAGIQTGQRHPAFSLPVRSSSFRFRRESDHDLTKHSQLMKLEQKEAERPQKGFYAHLRKRVVGSVVTKSQSTGSIKSKFGKALSSLTHKIAGDATSSNHSSQPDHRPSATLSLSLQQENQANEDFASSSANISKPNPSTHDL